MHKILVVDDDKITHAFIKKALVSKFELIDAFDGEQALMFLEEINPSAILLDVEMPKMNGYETCERIKSNPATSDIPVIFLSARDQLRDRMQGFEAGADDYMVKPFHAEDLQARLNVIIQYREERQLLSQQISEARKTAFIAISSSSDLGLAIQFIERSHNIASFQQLALAFFSVTHSMNLKCTLLMKTTEEELYFSSTHSSVSPMESELVKRLSTDKRFFDFGCRTQINYPSVSLLIKNMPLDDMERYGRIKDFFPAMLSAADIKINQICAQIAMKKQLEEIQDAFANVTVSLEVVKSALEENQKTGVKIMRDMMMELDMNLPKMALDDDQERYILDRIDIAIDKAHHAISSNKDINVSFRTVLQNLKTVLNRQQEIQDMFIRDTQEEEILDASVDDGYEMDIELF